MMTPFDRTLPSTIPIHNPSHSHSITRHLQEAPCYGKVGLHFNNDKDDRQHHRQLGTTAGAPAPASWKAPVASISCVARNCKICGLITKLIAAFSNALGQITYIDVVLETRSVFLDDKDSQ